MNDMEREYRQLCRIDENPGVQGLAQLGRNAIDRVTQLESENAYLRAANSDGAALLQKLQAERAAIKGDYDEAAHLARHFIRDDPGITPRGAIIRLGDKCTDLFCRRQSAEQERDQLRAELAAAVGERDMLSELAQRRERQLSVALNEVEQLRAFRQAIDSAPVVARPKFIRGEICGCQTRPTHYVGEMDCPWHKRGDGQPKEAKD